MAQTKEAGEKRLRIAAVLALAGVWAGASAFGAVRPAPEGGGKPRQSGVAVAEADLAPPLEDPNGPLGAPTNERLNDAVREGTDFPLRSGEADEYRIGASDSLEVNVWAEPELSRRGLIVRRDGFVTLPLVQDVQVAGLTPMEAAERIRQGLERYVLDPQVTVIVDSFRSSSYYLFGEVAAPGEYPLLRETTVLEAVIRAGGFRQAERSGQVIETGDLSRILLFRFDEDGTMQTLPLDFSTYTDPGPQGEQARSQDMLLLPGDRVFIPERVRLAYVMGEVRSPGIVPLSERTTLLHALAERGGELSTANLKKVWVARTEGEVTQFNAYDIHRAMRKGDMRDNIVLHPGDVVYFSKTLIGSVREFVAVWSSTLQPAMSTYMQSWDAYYTADRYDALRENNFGQTIRTEGVTVPPGPQPPDY